MVGVVQQNEIPRVKYRIFAAFDYVVAAQIHFSLYPSVKYHTQNAQNMPPSKIVKNCLIVGHLYPFLKNFFSLRSDVNVLHETKDFHLEYHTRSKLHQTRSDWWSACTVRLVPTSADQISDAHPCISSAPATCVHAHFDLV